MLSSSYYFSPPTCSSQYSYLPSHHYLSITVFNYFSFPNSIFLYSEILELPFPISCYYFLNSIDCLNWFTDWLFYNHKAICPYFIFVLSLIINRARYLKHVNHYISLESLLLLDIPLCVLITIWNKIVFFLFLLFVVETLFTEILFLYCQYR